MRRRIRTPHGAVPGVLVAVALVGCAINPVTQSPDISLTSKVRERALGVEEAKKVELLLGITDDPKLGAYVDSVGQRLASRLPVREVPYSVQIVDSEVPNAFALPGGYVYLSRGLLVYLNSEDELACVIAHEIAHVAARHSMSQRTREILTSPLTIATGLAGAATGIVAPRLGEAVAGLGQVAAGVVLARYSREQEREADRIGMELAAAAGWNPAAMATMLTTLEREEKLVSGTVREGDFLDTHPSTPERVTTTAAGARTLRVSAGNTPPLQRRDFLQRLENLLVGTNPAGGVFQERTFLQPELAFAIHFPAQWKLHNSRENVAAAAPNDRAAVVVQLLGAGNDPLVAADARKSQIGFSLTSVARREIHGLSAARVAAVVATSGGRAALLLTWIAYDGKVYEITGIAPPEQLERYRTALVETADSFAALTPQQRRGIRAARLKIVDAQPDETLVRLLDRIGASWSPALAAVANGLGPNATLHAGMPVKAPILEPY